MLNSPRRGKAVTDNLLAKKKRGYTFPYGTCLKQIREGCDSPTHDYSPSNGHDPWAIEAWDNAHVKHRTSDPMKIPAHVPVFWRGVAGRPGHIAWSVGGGKCISTDLPNKNHFGIIYISQVHRDWGMTLLGWTEDFNERHCVDLPATPTPPVVKPAPPAGNTPWAIVRPQLIASLMSVLKVTQSNDAHKVVRLRLRAIITAADSASRRLLTSLAKTPEK